MARRAAGPAGPPPPVRVRDRAERRAGRRRAGHLDGTDGTDGTAVTTGPEETDAAGPDDAWSVEAWSVEAWDDRSREDGPLEGGTGGDDDLARLRATLLHGRSAHAAAPLRVEDPVHPPPGGLAPWPRGAETWAGAQEPWAGSEGDEPEGAWSGGGWPDAAEPWAEPWAEPVDPDGLAAGESARMHPDDLAALNALPTTRSESAAWGAGARVADEPRGGRREVLTGASTGEHHRWGGPAPLADAGRLRSGADPAAAGLGAGALLHRRWVQLVACALVALVVGAAATMLVTTGQVDAARAEADRQRAVAADARAELARERAARTAEPSAPSAPAPATSLPPVLTLPSTAPAAGTDPATLPGGERPPVAEAPAPTADAGPPPPGPSPSAARGAAQPQAPAPPRAQTPTPTSSPGPPPGSAPEDGSGDASSQGSADAADGTADASSSGGQPPLSDAPDQQCSAPSAGDPGAGGDGPVTCP